MLLKKGFVFAIVIFFFGLNTVSGLYTENIVSDKQVNNVFGNKFVKGEFIVKFKNNTIIQTLDYKDNSFFINAPSILRLNAKHHISSIESIYISHKQLEDLNFGLSNIYKFNVPLNSDILTIVQEYNIDSSVEYAEPNYIVKSCGIPNDPYFNEQWSLNNNGQTGGKEDADIDAVEAWDIETGSEDVIIAIIDSGINYMHPDLIDNIWSNHDEIPDNDIDDDNNGFVDDVIGWDFFNDDSDPMDDNSHGTGCAGIVGAVGNNGIGISGVCWDSKLMPIKSLSSQGAGSIWFLINGILYAADNGADVISMSLGGELVSSSLKDAVDYAFSMGYVLVAAAGNNADDEEFYPAAYDDVIAVSATNYKDKKIDASNYGNWIDVSAPGYDIYTTNLDNNYFYFSMTSSACPHVSGLAGLLLSQDPTLTNEEVRKIIRANVDPYDSEYYIGTGRINAYKALTRYNTQPENPEKPSGETKGKPGREYSFTSFAADDDGDDLYYLWDWGDGSYSEWLGPYTSGEECEASYTWQQEANFPIKVMVKDGKGGESYWSAPFIFSTPKDKAINIQLILYGFFQRFPFFEKIPNQMLL